ncbi:MAG: methyltransferase [Bacteriovoracaceae bacterium]|nr:methyltransferase [Bacteriovoracaceae bacterium]
MRNQINKWKMSELCRLCASSQTEFFAWSSDHRSFLNCGVCELKFVEQRFLPTAIKEKARYELHQNSKNDLGYQEFLKPLISAIKERSISGASGLDFGSGPASVLSHLLSEYSIELFDPFFANERSILEKDYDFIVCTEVLEHLHYPSEEFLRLKKSLRPSGSLYIMTLLWDGKMAFKDWHYQRDFTHVSFYSEHTFKWIKENLNFSHLEFKSNRVIVLS